MHSIRRIRHAFFWSQILGSFIQWIRLKPTNVNALRKKNLDQYSNTLHIYIRIYIYSHQSELYFLRIVIATFIISWSCQANLSPKMRYFPPFANNNPIFYPSLIWLSAVGLYCSFAKKILYGVALTKGYFHRCCYRQYLSNLFPYYRATILSDTGHSLS